MTQVRDELRVVEWLPPPGSDLSDPIRAEIAGDGETPRATAFRVAEPARRGDEFFKKALAGLSGRGILEAEISGELHFAAGRDRARAAADYHGADRHVLRRPVLGRAFRRSALLSEGASYTKATAKRLWR